MSDEIDIENNSIPTIAAGEIPAGALFHFGDPAQTGTAKLRKLVWATLDAYFAHAATTPRWFATITGRTGGTATDADSLATTGAGAPLAAGMAFFARTGPGGSINLWYVRAGTDAEDAAGGIVRPDDYHATTNQIVFELML